MNPVVIALEGRLRSVAWYARIMVMASASALPRSISRSASLAKASLFGAKTVIDPSPVHCGEVKLKQSEIVCRQPKSLFQPQAVFKLTHKSE